MSVTTTGVPRYIAVPHEPFTTPVSHPLLELPELDVVPEELPAVVPLELPDELPVVVPLLEEDVQTEAPLPT